MIDYEHKDMFLQDAVEKQLTISYGNTTITNEDLFNQTMTLEESLCSDQSLIFGSCEASVIKFKVANIVAPMKGQWLDVKMVLEDNVSSPFVFGRYKVDSDKFTADRRWKEVIAYDALYDVINADVIGWYNSVLPDAGSSITIKQLRTSFLGKFGIKEADISLANDEVVIKRTLNAEELSGATVIRAICEINGCFGHIGRDGLFHYIYLAQGIEGLYPSNDIYPADDLYPRDPKTTPIPKNLYINCTYEDFTTNGIEKLQIINGDTGIVSTVGSGDNCYTIESNFLVAGKTKEELDGIGERILEKIRGISYRPFDAECMGNPCFEVGDPVRLSTTYDIVETYILKRTLTGILALRDSYSSDGVKRYETKVNSIDRAVSQLNDKTDSLEEDVGTINEDIGTINEDIDIINEDIGDINENVGQLNISLQKTESGLQAEVSRAKTAEGDLSSRITMTESEISAEVTRAKSEENILSGRITLTAEQFQTDLTNTQSNLQSQITQTAGEISQKVSSSEFESYKTQTDREISQKVSSGGVISEINQSSDRIYLGAGQLVIDSGNLILDAYGNASFSGALSAVTGTFQSLTGLSGSGLNVYGISTDYLNVDYDSLLYGSLKVSGSFTAENAIYAKGTAKTTTTNKTNIIVINTTTGELKLSESSSVRYKHDITPLVSEELAPERLYDIPVNEYVYNCDYLDAEDPRYNKKVIGLIAEEVYKHYPIAAEKNDYGEIENWNDRYLIPPMLSLIQKQKKQLDEMSFEMQIVKMQINILSGGNIVC